MSFSSFFHVAPIKTLFPTFLEFYKTFAKQWRFKTQIECLTNVKARKRGSPDETMS